MKVKLMSPTLAATSNTIDVNDMVFDVAFNEALIHQVVTSTLTNARFGTKAQKTRAEVRGGGAKPWRQKGTGRARAGTIRSPLWRKGGVVFAAKPKVYNQKINKKMYAGAMRSILSELTRTERLIVIESFDIKTHKTKDMVKLLQPYLSEKVMLVVDDFDNNVYLSSRNIPNVYMVDVEFLDPVSLVGSDKVIFTTEALKRLEESLV